MSFNYRMKIQKVIRAEVPKKNKEDGACLGYIKIDFFPFMKSIDEAAV